MDQASNPVGDIAAMMTAHGVTRLTIEAPLHRGQKYRAVARNGGEVAYSATAHDAPLEAVTDALARFGAAHPYRLVPNLEDLLG